MAVYNAGDYPVNHTDIEIPFNTFTSNDPAASSTITELATTDIHIHKDGSVTQRTSVAGFTLTIDMDGITGNHLLQIDASDDTDVGFYAAGHEYTVRMEGTAIDAGTVNAWIGAFSIERAGGALALIKGGSITVGTCTTNTDMRGTDNAATAAKLLDYIQLLARSDAAITTDNAVALGEINANEGSGAGDFSNQTDAAEAVRDHIGNGTNLTETGGDGDHLSAIPTIAEVTLVGTCTTNSDLVTAAAIKAAMEVSGGDLDTIVKAMVNKAIWTEANGNLEMFNDVNASLGSITAQVATDGTFTTRKRMVV